MPFLPRLTAFACALGIIASSYAFAAAVPASQQIHLLAGTFDPLTEKAPATLRFQATGSPRLTAYYLVQLYGRLGNGSLRDLEGHGATVLSYIPDNSYLIRLPKSAVTGLANEPWVRWIGPWEPGYKIAPALTDLLARPDSQDLPATLRIRIFLTEELKDAWEEVAALGFPVSDSWSGEEEKVIVLNVHVQDIPAISQIEGVEWIDPMPVLKLQNNNTTWVVQSDLPGDHTLWDKGLRGEGQMVGVLDSGLDYGSCFFDDGNLSFPNPAHRKVIEYRSYGGDLHDTCIVGHGTHVSGTIAGNDLSGTRNEYNGVAPEALLTFGDIQDERLVSCLTGVLTFRTDLGQVFRDAKGDGAFIHNNSWGNDANVYDALAASVDQYCWNNKSFLPVFANGNAGPGAGTVGSPATAKNLIAVGATRIQPNEANIASFSSRGPTADGRFKPEVCAPGETVTSARNIPGSTTFPSCDVLGSIFSGTSMASPAVAGSAALVRQYFMDGFYPTGEAKEEDTLIPSAALLKAVILNGAQEMNGSGGRPSNAQGWGRVNLANALFFMGDDKALLAVDYTTGLATGGLYDRIIHVTEPGPLFVSLVWTDFPGNPGAAKTLVNNLNLFVDYGQTHYLGNIFSNGWSTANGLPDGINNVECVFLQNPPAGDYTIRVEAASVPIGGEQPFALVVRGKFNAEPPPNHPPALVTDLTAIDTPYDDGGSVTVTWTRSADDGRGENDVTGYTLFRRSGNNGPWDFNVSLSPGSEQYIDETTIDRYEYFYKVRTWDSLGQSSDTGEAGPAISSDNPPKDEAPPSVNNLRVKDAANDSGGAVELKWTKSPHDGADEDDITRYVIMRRGGFGTLPTEIGEVPKGVERFVDVTAPAGADSAYAVRVEDATGHSTQTSFSGSIRPSDNGGTEVPRGLIATPLMEGASLTWDAIADANFALFRVYRSREPNTRFTLAGETSNPSFQEADLQIGVAYWYQLTAVTTADLETVPGNVVQVVPAATDPEAPEIFLGGYMVTRLLSATGGVMALAALVQPPSGSTGTIQVELAYEGTGTGLFLADDGSQGDGAAGDHFFGFRTSLTGPLPATRLVLELTASGSSGAESTPWPWLTVE